MLDALPTMTSKQRAGVRPQDEQVAAESAADLRATFASAVSRRAWQFRCSR